MAAMNKQQARKYQRDKSYGSQPGEITRGLKPGDRFYDPDTNTWQLKPGRGVPGAVGVDEDTDPNDADDRAGSTVSSYIDKLLTGDNSNVQGRSGGAGGRSQGTEGSSRAGTQSQGGSGTSGKAGGGSSGQGATPGTGSQGSGANQVTTPAKTTTPATSDPAKDKDVQQAVAAGMDISPWLWGAGAGVGALIVAAKAFNRKNRKSGATRGGDTSGAADPATDTAGTADKGGTGDTPTTPPKSTAAADAAKSVAIPDEKALAAAMAPAAADSALAAKAARVKTAPPPTGAGVVDPTAADPPDVAKAKIAAMLGESDPTGSITDDFGKAVGAGDGLVDPYSIAPTLGADSVVSPVSEGPTPAAAADLPPSTPPRVSTPEATASDDPISVGPMREPTADLGPEIPDAREQLSMEPGIPSDIESQIAATMAPPREELDFQRRDRLAAAEKQARAADSSRRRTLPQIAKDIVMGTTPRVLGNETGVAQNTLPPNRAYETRAAQRALGTGNQPIMGPELEDFINSFMAGGDARAQVAPTRQVPGAAWTPAEIANAGARPGGALDTQINKSMVENPEGTARDKIGALAQTLVESGVKSPADLTKIEPFNALTPEIQKAISDEVAKLLARAL